MPTKRTRRARGRRVLTLDALDLGDILDLMAGWRPPRSEFERSRSRWQTWKEYLGDWTAVRDQVPHDDMWWADGEPPFAEQVYRLYGAGGPPEDATYEDVKAALSEAEERSAEELLASLDA
ncbi:MAG: hypothetical protein DCC55_27990 [Chloroflexi bacterium]|nr:MAG: hypothetical protein DCC55_27990 [Chloroflexota bacterium]